MNGKLTMAKQDVTRALTKASNYFSVGKAKESAYGGFDDATEELLRETAAAIEKALKISNSLNIEGRKKK
jgi:hypothetical protein